MYVNLFLLTFTTLWANSSDDKMTIVFLFFPENRLWHFMQTVSLGERDNLYEMSKPIFWEKKKKKKKYFKMSAEIFTQNIEC